MTTTAPKVSERDIAAAVVKHLTAQGLAVRQEVYVTLPDHGQVCADIVACKTDEIGEWFTVVECKRRLYSDLTGQIARWRGLSHNRAVAFEMPKRPTLSTLTECEKVLRRGIQTITFVDGVLSFSKATTDLEADTRLLSAAFHAHDGSHDPAAGSAAAKRMTQARCVWEPLRKYLKDTHDYAQTMLAKHDEPWTPTSSWSAIRRNVPEMRKFTAAKCRKAIDGGTCVGVGYRGESITEFYAKEKP